MLDISLKQMSYAVEIQRCGSMNRAAKNLYVSQSSLSKAMKELESTLGCQVFRRTPGGTEATEEGQLFLETAGQVVYELELLEQRLLRRSQQIAAMKISVPRATYITYAFTEFFKSIQDRSQIQINFSETNSQEAIENILNQGFQLGIIRYPDFMEDRVQGLLAQKRLCSKPIWDFAYMLLVSENSPLAGKQQAHPEDIAGWTELVHGDVENAFLPERTDALGEPKRIYLYERGSQFDFLSNVPGTYMWVSPLPQKVLAQHGLVQLPCPENRYRYRDALIFNEDHPFTGYTKDFYQVLLQTKDEIDASL